MPHPAARLSRSRPLTDDGVNVTNSVSLDLHVLQDPVRPCGPSDAPGGAGLDEVVGAVHSSPPDTRSMRDWTSYTLCAASVSADLHQLHRNTRGRWPVLLKKADELDQITTP